MPIKRLLHHWPLALIVLGGLGLRIALWDRLPRVGLISDEAEYLAAADWLANGRGFAWHLGWLWTRAPLYPLFLAGHHVLFGQALEPIFVSQTALSLLNIVLIYALAREVAPQRPWVGPIAALFAALYLPFASYAQFLLSETLFTTLLLAALLALGRWAATSQPGVSIRWLVVGGLLLGLATLTRGLTLGFMPIVGLWVFWRSRKQSAENVLQPMPKRRGLPSATLRLCLFVFSFCLVLLPWTVYASRTYGGLVVVDTTGSFNLLLGARTAYDGGRNDEPVRSFVLALLDPRLTPENRAALLRERRGRDGELLRRGACLYEQGDPRLLAALQRPAASISHGERQALISAEALCLLRAAPGAFVAKSLVELIDLFQINYTGDERLAQGFTLGRLPPWYTLALFLLDDTLYVLVLPLAVLGWSLLRLEAARGPLPSAIGNLLGLWLLYNLATAPLLFAINRFRVPLMPFVFVLAAAGLFLLPRGGWRKLGGRYGVACTALAALLGMVALAPYAYLVPRQVGADSRLASYLGPYPSSLSATLRALDARPAYLREQALAVALAGRDPGAVRAALAAPELPPYAVAVGAPLLAGLEGRPAAGLAQLATQAVRPLEGWQRSLVAGELLRQLGQLDAARAEFNPPAVDGENPVEWAWHWLAPPPLPLKRIELADDNDLGYVRGFYLGRYDPDLDATLRWASAEAQLRFPAAASGGPQQLCLRLSGLGWPADLALPPVQIFAGEQLLGAIQLTPQLETACLPLAAAPAGADIIVTLRSPTFVPDAADLLAQQGAQVGQLRRLGLQLDWAEVSP